ncbi:MAG: hypothetical protein Q8P67_11705, partial [archaeon]|nr:hypothetical protein [archaeon]
EARCLYHDLLAAFEDPSCDLVCKPFELSFECRQALQRFACYNSFRPCDESGFQTSTCRAACETVESQCVQTFSGVGYSRYSCGSANYIDNDSFPELRCAGPQLWLTEADTPVVVPDVLASYDNFAEVLLDNTLMPEQVFNYGFQAPTNLEN